MNRCLTMGTEMCRGVRGCSTTANFTLRLFMTAAVPAQAIEHLSGQITLLQKNQSKIFGERGIGCRFGQHFGRRTADGFRQRRWRWLQDQSMRAAVDWSRDMSFPAHDKAVANREAVQNVAQGASPGYDSENDPAPKERKKGGADDPSILSQPHSPVAEAVPSAAKPAFPVPVQR